MPIEALIIDDEPLAREKVRGFLDNEGDIQIVAECRDGKEALEAIEEHRPQLVFLDVQMPEMDGFEVLANVEPDHLPTVIFTTAFDQYALKAFDVHAVDYLL
ncbi:MAG: response regulator, partial [Acidobacteriota bacterium]